MRICFTLGMALAESGITKVVINLANLLAQQDLDYEVHLLCIADSSEIARLDINKNIILESFYKQKNKYSCYIGAACGIHKYCLEKKIQALVISGMEWVPFYFLGLRGVSVSVYAWEHLNFKAGPKFRLEWIGKRLACRYSKGIINITKKDQAMYRTYSAQAKLYQIYNICGVDKCYQNYNQHSKKIISVGYLASIKGFDMLIDVAKKVLPQYPEWSWDIYGEGDMRMQLQESIDRLQLQKQLHLMGYHENLNELYKEYGFYVMTSRAEGFGMVLMEAQKSGLPIVSFDIPCGPSDTIINEKNGYLIPPFDKDEMARKILELIQNVDLRIQFSQNADCCHREMQNEYILEAWHSMLADGKEQNEEDIFL